MDEYLLELFEYLIFYLLFLGDLRWEEGALEWTWLGGIFGCECLAFLVVVLDCSATISSNCLHLHSVWYEYFPVLLNTSVAICLWFFEFLLV